MSKYKVVWLSIAFFLINFLFKLIDIGSSSLWHDEALSIKNTFLEFGHIKHESEWDANPPFYYYCLWVWSHIFGSTEIAVRTMSAFFSGLAACCFFYFLQRRNTLRISLAFSFIFLVHPFLFYYAQEARSYSLVVFLLIANLIICENYYKKRTYSNALLLGLFNFLLFYTHYITGLYIFVQFIFLISDFKQFGKTLLSYLSTLVLILLRFTAKQYRVIFFSSDLSQTKNNIEISSFSSLLEVLNSLFFHYSLSFFFLIFVCFYLVNSVLLKKSTHSDSFQLFLLLTPCITIVVFYILGKFTNVFAARYLIYVVPLVLSGLGSLQYRGNIPMVIIIGMGIYLSLSIQPGKDKGMDYRLAAKIIKSQNLGLESVIVLQTHDVAPLFTYYYNFDLFKSNPRSNSKQLGDSGIYTIDNFTELPSFNLIQKKQIFLLQSFVTDAEKEFTKEKVEKLDFKSLGVFQLKGVSLSVFRKD